MATFMVSLSKDMIMTYLKRRADDIVLLKQSLANNSTEEFNRVGHQLLGNARNFGFPTLEPIAMKMENLSVNDLPKMGSGLIDELSDWLQNTLKTVQ